MVDLEQLQRAVQHLREAQAKVQYAEDISNIAVNNGCWIGFNEAKSAIDLEVRKLRQLIQSEQTERNMQRLEAQK